MSIISEFISIFGADNINTIAALIITSLAGVYPARRASRLNPAEALRFE